MKEPYDKELEEMVIGNALMYAKLSPEARNVSTTDFHVPSHQQIWNAMLAFDEDDKALDVMALAAYLNDPSIPASVLSRLTIGLPWGSIHYDSIQRLKDLAVLRRMIHSFRDLAQRASDKERILDIVDDTQKMLDVLKDEQDAREGTSQSVVEVMEREVYPRLDKYLSGELVKIPFGFEALDVSTNGGAALGELVVLAALPKSGKSILLLQIARQIAELKLPSLMVSLEMLNYENGFRLLAQSSRYSVNVFRPDIAPFVVRDLKEHGRQQYELPLYFDQKSRTMKEIGQEVARLKDTVGLTTVFIDYAQLIKNDRRNVSRFDRIEEAMVDMKELAMKHQIVVYTAAQFNREGIKAERPTLSHFDGSSAIEKTANLGLLWTLEPDYDAEVDGRKGELWIELGRSVATDNFNIVFHGKDARFSIYDRR